MKKENLGKIQAKLDLMTRKRWFFLFFILLQFVPPYASKGYELPEWGFVVGDTMRHGFIFSCSQLYPIFKVIPIILIISIIFFKNKVVRTFSVYGGITYILFAFLHLIGITKNTVWGLW